MSMLKTYMYSDFLKQSLEVAKTQTQNLFSNIYMLFQVNLENQSFRKHKTEIHV